MKYIIASDLHGSVQDTFQLLERANELNVDKIIILGDLYYHGPRNPLSQTYAPLELSDILNGNTERLIAVRGNCDADIDVSISNFPIPYERLLDVDGLKVFLTHGHLHDETFLPSVDFDVMIHGHTHFAYINQDPDGTTYANPGSITLPKDGNRCYLLLEGHTLSLCDVETGNVRKSVTLHHVAR